jgi:hypothetical protein
VAGASSATEGHSLPSEKSGVLINDHFKITGDTELEKKSFKFQTTVRYLKPVVADCWRP